MHSVHRGQIWANSQQMAYAVEALAASHSVRAVDAHGLNLLSKRELEVVRCLAEGLTNREIADQLGLSQHTIKNYLFRVFDKLGVSSRVELLFMTLSQNDAVDVLVSTFPLQSHRTASFRMRQPSPIARQAAEQGAPIAQLALAQMHATRRANSKDLMQAYMWYLIASEKISQAGKSASEVAQHRGTAPSRTDGRGLAGQDQGEPAPPRMKNATQPPTPTQCQRVFRITKSAETHARLFPLNLGLTNRKAAPVRWLRPSMNPSGEESTLTRVNQKPALLGGSSGCD